MSCVQAVKWDLLVEYPENDIRGWVSDFEIFLFQVRDERIISGCEDGTVRIWELFATVFRSGDPANNDTIPTEVINVRGEHH